MDAMEQPKILIVDDVPSNVQILHQILKENYKVLFATSGLKAIELAAQQNPDIILLDVKMPDIDGYEACRRLKQDPATRNIPVIFITALQDTRDEEAGFEAGGVDFITKPVSPPIVRARVGTHVELKRQRDAFQQLSLLDGLTGIANRRNFDESLSKSWRRGARTNSELSVVLFDVDCFKQFNDFYGHQAGDSCLKRVAEALSEQVRRVDDLAARYGGEEFVLLLPHTQRDAARAIAEKALEAVREAAIPHQKSSAAETVTLSAGVASVVPSLDIAPSALLEWADKNLYRAKESGRNRVESGGA